ncbi:uncharacterized protein BDZ99DRAFT_556547 [Mytilinidion resinicola]|uniref:Uncharacterized protein n=1 Tax=Mytilinidion resinicola TaxID=574789 RepID=A0A6A6YZ13_9PEZI|nr:uncharacterized protein BDZ99DRAFT_556547 [Mytilinidion resinicola]KAF2813197.1 hypothetical protein BDZ99DRAFT_556547 [Mytilinidion resinicola]
MRRVRTRPARSRASPVIEAAHIRRPAIARRNPSRRRPLVDEPRELHRRGQRAERPAPSANQAGLQRALSALDPSSLQQRPREHPFDGTVCQCPGTCSPIPRVILRIPAASGPRWAHESADGPGAAHIDCTAGRGAVRVGTSAGCVVCGQWELVRLPKLCITRKPGVAGRWQSQAALRVVK